MSTKKNDKDVKDVLIPGGVAAGSAYGINKGLSNIPVSDSELLFNGKYKGRKLQIYDPWVPEIFETNDKFKKFKKPYLKLRNTLFYSGNDVVDSYKNLDPKNKVIYNYSLLNLKDLLKTKDGVINNADSKFYNDFSDKYTLHNSPHLQKHDLHIPTQTFQEFLEHKTGRNLKDLSEAEVAKVLKDTNNEYFIKPRVSSQSLGAYSGSSDFVTSFDERYGKNGAGKPALKMALENPNTYIVQPNLPSEKEFRVHATKDKVLETSYHRWGARTAVPTSMALDKNTIAKLKDIAKNIIPDDSVIGFDIVKTKNGVKIVEANPMSDFFIGRAVAPTHLNNIRKIVGKGTTPGILALSAAGGLLGGYASGKLLEKTASKKEKKNTNTVLPTLAVGAGITGITYGSLRSDALHPAKTVRNVQELADGKVTSVHYGPKDKLYKTLNKVLYGGSIDFINKDDLFIDGVRNPKDITPFYKWENESYKPRLKGALYVGHNRSSVKGVNPDVGINMYPFNKKYKTNLKKENIAKSEIFKDIAIHQGNLKEFLNEKGIDPVTFSQLPDDQVETMFKKWHTEQPIFVKEISSNMQGLYGDLDSIRYKSLHDVGGEKVYLDSKKEGGNYKFLKDVASGAKEDNLLFGHKIEGKEYRMHFLNGKFINATPRWGSDFGKYTSNVDEIGQPAIEQLEKVLTNFHSNNTRKARKLKNSDFVDNVSHTNNKFIGADVIIDKNGHAKIIEANNSPMTLGMPITNLRSDQVRDIKNDFVSKKGREMNKLEEVFYLTKARFNKAKDYHNDLKGFYKALTGKQEFRNIAIAKGLAAGVGAGVATKLILNTVNKNE